MRDSVVSPRFEEGEYKGQDVVHQGVRIPINTMMMPNELLKKFSRRAQRIIEDAGNTPDIVFKIMTSEDLPVLRSLWFDPEDKTFPNEMGEHVGVVACMSLSGEIIGGAIWAPQGKNLFLHQLIASEWAKKEHQLPTLLIWESVRRYYRGWHALDIGVSYNPKRYGFFQNFAVETYPIILKKPFYTPVIRLSPFRGFDVVSDEPVTSLGDNVTFLPRASYALYAALRHIGVGVGDQVMIVKTFKGTFISGCVTNMIAKTGAAWSLPGGIVRLPRAVLVIHEFGIPVMDKDDLELLRKAQEMGVPVIEDCAWRWSKVFTNSDYAIFSAQKIFNMNYGGLLDGVKISDERLWGWGCLDTVKRDRYNREAKSVGLTQRKQNWKDYHALVLADGMMPDDRMEYAAWVEDDRWMPTVYLQRFESDEIADAIVARLEEFGIQAGRYWGEPVVYLPIHQNMTLEEVEYMFAVVRGYFNMCRDYKGAKE